MTTRRYWNPRIETMSRDELRALQWSRVRHVLEAAYATNPFHRARFDREGLHPDKVRSLEEFQERVPFIEKRDLLADQAEAPPLGTRVQPAGQRIGYFSLTSGTTGIGQEIHLQSLVEGEVAVESFCYMLRWAGARPGDRAFLCWPMGLQIAGHFARHGLETYGVVMLLVAPLDARAKLEAMKRFSPDILIAAPSYVQRLAVICDELGLRPDRDFPNLRIILTAAEPYPVSWATRMEAFWHARITEWYGSTQAGINQTIACEEGVYHAADRRGMLHALEHLCFVEVLDPATRKPVAPGETGEVVITPLFRSRNPLIRFRMEDRVRYLPPEYCRCGRPFAGIEAGSVARYDDMIKVKMTNVWPEAVDAVVFAHPEVEEYNARVWIDDASKEHVDLTLELKRGAELEGDDQRRFLARLRDDLRQRIGVSMDCTVVPRGTLPRFEIKARRWHDERRKDRTPIQYLGR